ncbi:MAG: hypothetical protein JXA20_16190 [Spirochaetes bacterium]|nr:hypothetical protein [Spirochaetota bacterium]
MLGYREGRMDIDQIPTAVKWIGSVLIAGFIAQFGKMLAEYLIKRYRERRVRTTGGAAQDTAAVSHGIESTGPLAPGKGATLADEAKARKKLLKAEAKARKKGLK